MYSMTPEDTMEGQQDVWLWDFPSPLTAQAQSQTQAQAFVKQEPPSSPQMFIKQEIPTPSETMQNGPVANHGQLGADEDFLEFLERPLLFEDVQQVMEIENALYGDALCGEFKLPVGATLENTIEDLNEVIKKELEESDLSCHRKTYTNLDCQAASYTGSSAVSALPEHERSISFSEQNMFLSLLESGSAGYISEGSLPGSPSSPLSSSVSSCSDLDLENGVSSDMSLAGSPTVETLPQKVPRSRRRRGQHLWEFIIEVIRDSRYNPNLIRWLDKERGIFKIVKSQEVAKLWGQRKGNATMSYEYMSRAMRHYYNNGILKRVYGKRLVYQFGPRAYGWDEHPTSV